MAGHGMYGLGPKNSIARNLLQESTDKIYKHVCKRILYSILCELNCDKLYISMENYVVLKKDNLDL